MTSHAAIMMPARWRAADAQALGVRFDAFLAASVLPEFMTKAKTFLIDHLRGEEVLPKHVEVRNGSYYWRPKVIGNDGQRCKINRSLGEYWDAETKDEYDYYEKMLKTARSTGDYKPLFAAMEARKAAKQAEKAAEKKAVQDVRTLRDLWARAGHKFITRGGASYETVLIVWGGLKIGALTPQAIDDGIRKMEAGDYSIPQRGGKSRRARPLSLNSINRYLGAFRRALAVLRHTDATMPDIFSMREKQLPPGNKLIDLIYPDRADATTITQRRKPSVYLDWNAERLPFLAAVLASGLPYAHDLVALLIAVSLLGARPGSLAVLTWEAVAGGNYVDAGNIVLHQTKVTKRRRKSVPEIFEINEQLQAVLDVQHKRTGGKGRVFPSLPADACDAIDRLADRWKLTRLRSYLFKHSMLTDLALIPGGTPAQLSAEVHIKMETLDKYYVHARGVKVRHYRPGKPGATILSQLWYNGLEIDVKRGVISIPAAQHE